MNEVEAKELASHLEILLFGARERFRFFLISASGACIGYAATQVTSTVQAIRPGFLLASLLAWAVSILAGLGGTAIALRVCKSHIEFLSTVRKDFLDLSKRVQLESIDYSDWLQRTSFIVGCAAFFYFKTSTIFRQ